MPWSMSTRHITPHEWPCHKWWRNWSYSLWLFDPKRSCQNYQIGLPNLLHLVKCRQRHVCLAAWLCHTGYPFSTNLIKSVGIKYIWRHVCHTVRAIHYMRKKQYYNITVLQYYNITILQYYNITILQYYNITILQYYNFTILQYYNITLLKYCIITMKTWKDKKICIPGPN